MRCDQQGPCIACYRPLWPIAADHETGSVPPPASLLSPGLLVKHHMHHDAVFPSRPSRGRLAAPRCSMASRNRLTNRRWTFLTCFSPEHGKPITGTDGENGAVGLGRPCADRLPRRHPASAPGPRFCRGRFQNTKRSHLGSNNRVLTRWLREMEDALCRVNRIHRRGKQTRRLPLAQITHSEDARGGSKFPRQHVLLPPGLRHAHGRCSLFLTVHASGHPPAFPSGTCRKKG